MQDREGIVRDLGLLVLANFLWGSTDAVAKLAISDMSPEALAWTRFSVTMGAFAPVLWIRRREIPLSFRKLMPFVGLGITGFFLNFYLQYHGLKFAPASHATTFRITETLVIVFYSVAILREKIGWKAIAGLICGIEGVVVVLDVDLTNLGLFRKGARLGDLLMLGGIFVEGLYTIIGKRVLATTRPLTATALGCAFGWLMLTVFFGAKIHAEYAAGLPSWGSLAGCVYLGLFATALSYWIYYLVLSRRKSHRVGMSIMIQPLVGIPLAAILFGDEMTLPFICGAALIATGVYLALGEKST